MKIFCIERFKSEYERKRSKSQRDKLHKELIRFFFNGNKVNDVLSGTRLNRPPADPYIKKRLGGRGGFRIYYLVRVKTDSVYLLFFHAKTGKHGGSNINDETKAALLKEVAERLVDGDLYEVTYNKKSDEISIKKKEKTLKKKDSPP